MRVQRIILAVMSICLSAQACWAATALDAQSKKELAQLEQKYFGATFTSDSDEVRTSRIEKLMFGDASSGNVAARIKQLAQTAQGNEDADAQAASQPAVAPQQAAAAPAQSPRARGQVSTVSGADNESAVVTDNYPHITDLEKTILGQPYLRDKLQSRIARMEVKAFGKASASDDLSARTDALESYAETKLNKPRVPDAEAVQAAEEAQAEAAARAALAADGGTGSGAATAVSAPGDYPRVTYLEQNILGKSYAGQPLADRLSRMEVTAFGSASNGDLSDRTDALEKYMEKKLHKKAFQQEQRQEAAATGGNTSAAGGSSSGFGGKLLNIVGNSLLGLAGVNNMPSGGYAPGAFPGLGGPGLGFSPGGMGMGGGRRRQMMQQQQQAPRQPEAPVRQDDPAVNDRNPPPDSARFITKVGWCEVWTFGHTFPTMHLSARLRQLNDEMRVDKSNNAMALMDDINPLIKAVAARIKSGQPIAATPSTTH